MGSKKQADALMAAGVSAETLWRAHLMAHPELLNREGIEVVPVSPSTATARLCAGYGS